jgi:hypothetical protein
MRRRAFIAALGGAAAWPLVAAYSKNNPDLKSWASRTLPHLKEHLSMAEKLK